MTATEKLAICAASAFALAVALTPAAKALALRLNLIAPPCEESGHPEPTPVLGGVAIVLAVIGALGLVGDLPPWLTAGMVALLAVGIIDDAVVLTPSRKLLAQLMVVAFFLWVAPVGPEITRWPSVNLALAGFFMVAAINAFNLIDGLDGLAAGVGIAAMSAGFFRGHQHRFRAHRRLPRHLALRGHRGHHPFCQRLAAGRRPRRARLAVHSPGGLRIGSRSLRRAAVQPAGVHADVVSDPAAGARAVRVADRARSDCRRRADGRGRRALHLQRQRSQDATGRIRRRRRVHGRQAGPWPSGARPA